MASTDSIRTTAACDLGRHSSCRSVVLTLTTAGTVNCTCTCHSPIQALPDAWREQATLTPPCDEDAILDHDEIERLTEIESDRRLDDVGLWS
jgi:hypothetical protein